MKVVARPIDAIVVFKGAERPLPYKFRYSDPDGITREVLVGRILLAEKRNAGGIDSLVYECQSRIEGTDRRYQLKYLIDECRWMLYKI